MKFDGLDLKDKRILHEIDLNARLFISEIAKKVKLNKEVVKYRIRTLEKKGVIRGYQTIINTSKLGLTQFEYYINVMDMTLEEFDVMRQYLVNQSTVTAVFECDVVWDLVTKIIVKDGMEFYRFYEDFKKKFRKFIEKDDFEIVVEKKFCSRTYIPEEEKQFIEVPFSEELVDFDETDIKLLKLVSFDAKASLIDLAKKLVIDSMTVKKRLQKLQKNGVICGFRTIADTKELNTQLLSVRLALFDMSNVNTFKEYVSRLPQTVKVRKALSNYDVEFDLEVENFFELSDIIHDLKKKFPIIREVTHFETISVHKEASFMRVFDKFLPN